MKWLVLLTLAALLVVGGLAWWRGLPTPAEDAARMEGFRERETTLGMRARGLAGQEARLQAAIAETLKRSQALAETLVVLKAEEKKQAAERKRLVESGTPEEVMEAARKLGYHPKACR